MNVTLAITVSVFAVSSLLTVGALGGDMVVLENVKDQKERERYHAALDKWIVGGLAGMLASGLLFMGYSLVRIWAIVVGGH